jgi:dipeptidyl aminopeptidase/acylaminoacyl peptidase
VVSGEWDRSPQNMQWKEDGNGVYFTAQDQGSQNLQLMPLAGTRADDGADGDAGTHMLTTTSMAGARRLACSPSPNKPPDIVSYDLAASQTKQLTARQRRHPHRPTLGEVKEMWYTRRTA